MNTTHKQNKDRQVIKKEAEKKLTPFQKMLLKGPVIDDDQFKEYKKIIGKSRKWQV